MLDIYQDNPSYLQLCIYFQLFLLEGNKNGTFLLNFISSRPWHIQIISQNIATDTLRNLNLPQSSQNSQNSAWNISHCGLSACMKMW